MESPTFYPHLSGRDNLRYLQGIAGPSNPAYVDHLPAMVGLAERGDAKFRTYSLGMKQRLGLAYALLGDLELLVLDEPTNGMDPAGMAEVRDLIRELGREGHTVLLSSHLLHELEQVCDTVAIMSRGRLIAQGAVQELLAGRGAVRIRTTDDGKAAEIAASLPWVSDVRPEDGALVVMAPPERSPDISAALARGSTSSKWPQCRGRWKSTSSMSPETTLRCEMRRDRDGATCQPSPLGVVQDEAPLDALDTPRRPAAVHPAHLLEHPCPPIAPPSASTTAPLAVALWWWSKATDGAPTTRTVSFDISCDDVFAGRASPEVPSHMIQMIEDFERGCEESLEREREEGRDLL